jgi:uncharacterized membrane protein YeaQ/YmgE (transglycosylase-associated protein family)
MPAPDAASVPWKVAIVLISWISLGFFTGIGFHFLYGDGMKATGKVLVAIVGAVGGGVVLGFVASRVLPAVTFFTSVIPAILGAVLALYAYRIAASRQG